MSGRHGKFGPYVYTADLGVLCLTPDCAFRRWASVHEISGTSHLVYHMEGGTRDRFMIRRFLRAAEGAMGGPGSRGLAIDAYALHPSGTACLVTRYPGDLGGVTTLRQLVRVKGGKLAPGEAARAAEHLIEALELGEASGRMHGEFDLDSCVVDRGGRVAIELYGFRPRWSRGHDDVERLSWDHRASMARSVREMLGGDGLPRVWSEWSERLEQEPCVAWSEVRGSMPREVGVSSGTGTLVRTLWERVKQLAGKG